MESVTFYTREGGAVCHLAQLIASVSSFDPELNADRWSELSLYITPQGHFLCQGAGKSRVPGEVTRYQLKKAGSTKELFEALGFGWLAKRLYSSAGIEHAKQLDPHLPAGNGVPWHLERDGDQDLVLYGHKLLSVTTDHPAGSRPRWTELHLFRISSGKLVCHELGCSRVKREITRRQAYIALSPRSLMEQIGEGRLANMLYQEMGWRESVCQIPRYKQRKIQISTTVN